MIILIYELWDGIIFKFSYCWLSVQKLTLSQPAERDEAIHEYTSSDLLGLHGQIASDSGKSILPYLLTPSDVVLPHPLQQSAARLLNALASLRCGRDYLSVGPAVLNVVRYFENFLRG